MAFFENNPQIGLLGTLPRFIDFAGNPVPISSYAFVTDNESIQRELLDSNCIRHGSVMIRRQWLEVVGLYDVELEPSEDYDLWLRLAEVTGLANLEEPLYLYREHPDSESDKRCGISRS